MDGEAIRFPQSDDSVMSGALVLNRNSGPNALSKTLNRRSLPLTQLRPYRRHYTSDRRAFPVLDRGSLFRYIALQASLSRHQSGGQIFVAVCVAK